MSRGIGFGYEYQLVAASQAAKVLAGQTGNGALGDFLGDLTIIPATTSPGNVQIKDGSGTAMTIFIGGATSVADLKPIHISVNAKSVVGPWQVTTGANVSVFATGRFQ